MILSRLVEPQFERLADRVALKFGDRQLTYAQLGEETNKIATLLHEQGIGPNVPVGIFIRHCLELPAIILGILKAGGVCFPLSPKLPRARLKDMLDEVNPPLILTQKDLVDQLPSGHSTVFEVDAPEVLSYLPGKAEFEETVTDKDLAFLFYTSGTTGTPKGVMLSHGAVATRMTHVVERLSFEPEEQDLMIAPISFVVLIDELFVPLLTGISTVIAEEQKVIDSGYLISLINQHKVSILRTTPSLLRALLDDPDFKHCTSLKTVGCSGESLQPELQKKFFSILKARLLTGYGCTEATGAMSWECQKKESRDWPMLGKPTPPAQVYLINDGKIAKEGEIYIGGPTLSEGYYKRPDLTNERFIKNTFDDSINTRLYRTGDFGRCHEDGTMEFLGRSDAARANIRGIRIDLMEIERAMERHRAVKQAMTLVCNESRQGQQLVAFWVSENENGASINELREFLSLFLPAYMIPARFIQMAELPLTASRKLDRSAMLNIGSARPQLETPYKAPRNLTEERITEIWKEMLNLDCVGVDDNFFELGGDSLRLLDVLNQLRQSFSERLSISTLLGTLTISDQAALVSSQKPC